MDIRQSIAALGPWYHNFHLQDGIQTAPDHFLGDFPSFKWSQIESSIPENLANWSCLDIGCSAGFYSFELAKRGARVTGIDSDPHSLKQAEWIAQQLNLKNPPTFLEMQVHELARIPEEYDLVLFLGVFYHLRYPTLALDTIARKVKKLMIFQTLTMENEDQEPEVFLPAPDYEIHDRDSFCDLGWPKMAFIENRFSNDETNWWVPNHAGVMAMLRSTGFEKVERIAHEMYLCKPPVGGVCPRRSWDEQEWNSATQRE